MAKKKLKTRRALLAAREKREKAKARRVKAIATALAKVDWRLNFHQPSPLDCSIVSTRGAKLPKILATMQSKASQSIQRVSVLQDVGPLPTFAKEYMLFLHDDFIEMHCDIMLLRRLVVMYGFKIRCNYQLEALEQTIRGPLHTYREVASISDGRWNQMPEFRDLLAPGVHDSRRTKR